MWRARCRANWHDGFGERAEETELRKRGHRASVRLHLVSHAGLVPLLELAEQAGLSRLLDERIRSGAANPTPKLVSIIAGMAAGADSIDDLDVVRAGGMKQLFGGVYANATLGILLREFTHGHTRQLSAVLRRHLVALAEQTGLLSGIDERCFADIDSLLRPVYGKAKQGASFGHTKIAGKTVLRRGLSPLAVTISTRTAAPVVAGVRLRAGKAGSSRGAAGMVTEAINTAVAAGAQPGNILVRGDYAFCSGKVVTTVVKAGATFSFAIARNSCVDAAIDSIPDDAYIPVHYPGAVEDPDTGDLISDARPASRKPVTPKTLQTPSASREIAACAGSLARVIFFWPGMGHFCACAALEERSYSVRVDQMSSGREARLVDRVCSPTASINTLNERCRLYANAVKFVRVRVVAAVAINIDRGLDRLVSESEL